MGHHAGRVRQELDEKHVPLSLYSTEAPSKQEARCSSPPENTLCLAIGLRSYCCTSESLNEDEVGPGTALTSVTCVQGGGGLSGSAYRLAL